MNVYQRISQAALDEYIPKKGVTMARNRTTTIRYDEGEDVFILETPNRKWKNVMDKYEVEPDEEAKDGTNVYEVPLNWLRIQRPAQRSEEEVEAAKERLAAAREARFGPKAKAAAAPTKNGKAKPAVAKKTISRRARDEEDEDEDEFETEDVDEELEDDEDEEEVTVVKRKPTVSSGGKGAAKPVSGGPSDIRRLRKR